MIKSMKKYTFVIISFLLIVLIWLFYYLEIIDVHKNREENYFKCELLRLQSEIESISKTYEDFSNYIYEKSINKPEVLELFYKASLTEGREQDSLRNQLYEMLEDEYKIITSYNFRQLHFHFKNGDSFLRFHSPELFGDNLFSVRDSVRIANLEQRYIFGFEEGRIFNGYRFVWPLYYNNSHIGSVEVSVSLSSWLEILKKLYPENNMIFILKRDIVENAVFTEKQVNYTTSILDDDYMVDKEIYEKINSDSEGVFNLYKIKEIVLQIKEKAALYIDNDKAFAFNVYYQNEDYLVQFLPIESISKKVAGYYISIKKDNQIAVMEEQKNRELILFTVLLILILIFLLIFSWDKIKVEKMAETDILTGIFNRRKFYELAKKELSRSIRYNKNLSVLMLDIDHFKNVNDTYGHDAGDLVLKSISKIIGAALRDSDIFVRWGGEEFIILMPEIDINEGALAAERLRKIVAEHNFSNAGKVTISIGVSHRLDCDSDIQQIIKRADDALYKAKTEGRNRVLTI